ncbi:NCK-interacting protein with SH3 domain-like isoform X2 [Limulus polyphemus]|uniref:NCK-interacting protein with SH3 domain-like isoform X2 n=1 Tax=Limulus polyphemus TaxID=6850 RepID=A0ABM1T6E7_LIMPO|nr:NCK-interacting protein with SH3 domain-like isoform X2 [Limulus polyphemus]
MAHDLDCEFDTVLYEALYSLKSNDSRILSFKEGEHFRVVDTSVTEQDSNWIRVVNRNGISGFVPTAYVTEKKVQTTEFLSWLERAISAIHQSGSSSREPQRGSLRMLVDLRSSLLSHLGNKVSELPDAEPVHQTTFQDASNTARVIVHTADTQTGEHEEPLPEKNICGPELLVKLVEEVRRRTDLSHQQSKNAVSVVLEIMKDYHPDLKKMLAGLTDNEIQSVNMDDEKKMCMVLNKLWSCRNDQQQRSWPVHEDEAVIKEDLVELATLLEEADPFTSQRVLQSRNYEDLVMLATYYQMEPRRELRLALLQVFVILCDLDMTIVKELLYSVLPMELARDIQTIVDDDIRIKQSAMLLTILFSTGERPPNDIYGYINEGFCKFVFSCVDGSVDEEMADMLLAVLLAFNLHLEKAEDNLILLTLGKQPEAAVFTQKLLLLVNREDDPVNILQNRGNVPNSTLKMLLDIFGNPTTASLFYLNDTKVLLDIITRQLMDLTPGDKRRLTYLALAENVICHCDYETHFHQRENLQKILENGLSGECSTPEEKQLAKQILQRFSEWFTYKPV